ncbi:unnamed protein product [Ectocarpus sp. 8 AP-2014]
MEHTKTHTHMSDPDYGENRGSERTFFGILDSFLTLVCDIIARAPRSTHSLDTRRVAMVLKKFASIQRVWPTSCKFSEESEAQEGGHNLQALPRHPTGGLYPLPSHPHNVLT